MHRCIYCGEGALGLYCNSCLLQKLAPEPNPHEVIEDPIPPSRTISIRWVAVMVALGIIGAIAFGLTQRGNL